MKRVFVADSSNKSVPYRGTMICEKHVEKYQPPFIEKTYSDEEYDAIYLNGDGCPDCYAEGLEEHRAKLEQKKQRNTAAIIQVEEDYALLKNFETVLASLRENIDEIVNAIERMKFHPQIYAHALVFRAAVVQLSNSVELHSDRR